MTKDQALALMGALESQAMPASAVLTFSPSESWDVQLDTSHVYTGSQLAQLAQYCATNGLTLTAQFTALGIT